MLDDLDVSHCAYAFLYLTTISLYAAYSFCIPSDRYRLERTVISTLFFIPVLLIRKFHSLQAIIISRFLLNLRRAAQSRSSAPTRLSGIRSSMFRMPTLPDIVEDMGQPLDHGPNGPDEEEGEEVQDALRAPAAGPSFVQGSSTGGGPESHPQGEAEAAYSVCHSFPLASVLGLTRTLLPLSQRVIV